MPLFSAGDPGGPRSTLGDLIVMQGPYAVGQRMTPLLAAVVDLTEINALRDELIALRDIASRAAMTIPPGPCASTLDPIVGIVPTWCQLRHGHEGDHESGQTRWRESQP